MLKRKVNEIWAVDKTVYFGVNYNVFILANDATPDATKAIDANSILGEMIDKNTDAFDKRQLCVDIQNTAGKPYAVFASSNCMLVATLPELKEIKRYSYNDIGSPPRSVDYHDDNAMAVNMKMLIELATNMPPVIHDLGGYYNRIVYSRMLGRHLLYKDDRLLLYGTNNTSEKYTTPVKITCLHEHNDSIYIGLSSHDFQDRFVGSRLLVYRMRK
ncbi:MAG: hypothetical protein U0796_03905 [Gemmatales bacterium]